MFKTCVRISNSPTLSFAFQQIVFRYSLYELYSFIDENRILKALPSLTEWINLRLISFCNMIESLTSNLVENLLLLTVNFHSHHL